MGGMATETEVSESGEFRWKPMPHSNVIVQIRGQILAYLAHGTLEVGDRLPAERELAARLGVSRPSVREAIKSLEAEGRLEVRHGQGVFVTRFTPVQGLQGWMQVASLDISEAYAMREVLEVPAARWAAERAQPQAIARVREAHDRLLERSRQEPVDFDQLQLLDSAFHQSIVEAAGNRFLEQTQGVLGQVLVRGMSTTLSAKGRLEASRVDHRAILDAIVAGDGPRAAAAARRHVRAAGRTARALFGDHSPAPTAE